MNLRALIRVTILILLAIASGLIVTWISIQIQSPYYHSFEQWCIHRNFLMIQPKNTVNALLQQAGTTQCKQATQILSQKSALTIQGDHGKYTLLPGVSDLRPLMSLSQLTSLNLDENDIVDLAPLRSLSHLVHLSIDSNSVHDLSPIQDLTRLTYLRASRNVLISDLQPLQTLINLEILELTGNSIQDVTPLSALTNLKVLKLIGNEIRDISSLRTLTQLKSLSVGSNPLVDRVCPVSPELVCSF